MRRFALSVRLTIVQLMLLAAIAGCQSWTSSLSGLRATKGERRVVQQAKNDPFPSPSDVGMQVVE